MEPKAGWSAMVHVTRFEPEVVQAIARHLRQGNLDQTETTPMKAVVSHGVTLGSRYQKAEELEAMDVMVEGVDPRLCGAMAAIWCDSKATRTYLVTMKGRFGEVARLIAAQLGRRDRRSGAPCGWCKGHRPSRRSEASSEAFFPHPGDRRRVSASLCHWTRERIDYSGMKRGSRFVYLD
jgi:hypothetical protein